MKSYPHWPYQSLLGTEDLEMVLPIEEGDILADRHYSAAITIRYFFLPGVGKAVENRNRLLDLDSPT